MNPHAGIPPIVLADPGDWGHMDGWGGWGTAVFGWLFMALIIVLVVWLIWTTTRSGESRGESGRPAHSTALEVLDGRYARGEIEREEYLQRKEDLRA